MGSIANGSLQPTWYGHVSSARDALILFEACLSGVLSHVPRRPHDRERTQLIKSGCVFIYEENASGIKRWTDGVPWSPSRILGNFLVYRELVKPFPPGEKKRATKKNKRPTKPGEPYPRSNSSDAPTSPTTPVKSESGIDNRDIERALIGSLVDSYGFKEGGLVKKTMSVNVHGVHHHLVSYYRLAEAAENKLGLPASDPRLANIEPRPDLTVRQNFRAPLDDNEDAAFMDQMSTTPQGGFAYSPGIYGRPTIGMGNTPSHAHHQSPMNLGYAGVVPPTGSQLQSNAGLPGNGPHMQSSGHSYIQQPLKVQQRGYPAGHALSPITTHDSYDTYNHGYQHSHENTPILSPERRDSQPQLQQQQQQQQQQNHHHAQTNPYARHGSLPSLPNGILDNGPQQQEQRPLDTSYWDRSGSNSSSGVYSRPSAGPIQQSPSTYSNPNQWNMMSPPGHSLPRPDAPWGGTDSSNNWGMRTNTPAARHNSYHATPQSN